MAEHNAKLHVKTNSGYDDINLQTKAEIVQFDNSSTELLSTNVSDAIKELDTNINTNKTSIGTIGSLLTSAKDNLVNAVNELYNKFSDYVLKTDIINNLVSTNTDKPLSANMGKELSDDITELKTDLSNKQDMYYSSIAPSGTTPFVTKKNMYHVDVSNIYGESNKSGYFSISGSDFGAWTGLPDTMPKSGVVIGIREVFPQSVGTGNTHILVKITELYPICGKQYFSFYNLSSWGTWRTITPTPS